MVKRRHTLHRKRRRTLRRSQRGGYEFPPELRAAEQNIINKATSIATVIGIIADPIYLTHGTSEYKEFKDAIISLGNFGITHDANDVMSYFDLTHETHNIGENIMKRPFTPHWFDTILRFTQDVSIAKKLFAEHGQDLAEYMPIWMSQVVETVAAENAGPMMGTNAPLQ